MMEKNEIMRGGKFWTDAIKKAGVFEQIPFFNDLITGKEPVQEIRPILENVKVADKIVDIYHWGGTSARIYLHIKN